MNETIRTAAISPLRQRMIDDMNVRRFSRETQRNYVRDVGRFATFLGRSPDTATPDDVRQFQIDQREAGVSTPTMNSIVSALRFFFTQTIDRPDLARKLVRAAHPRNLPVVLSRDEVVRLLNATTTVKYQAALSVAYGAGLRVAEVAALKVTDVDGERMLLRVERGKGGRYRNAMLPADLLTLLREWWKVGRQQGVMHPQGWLFPGQDAMRPVSTTCTGSSSRRRRGRRSPSGSGRTRCGTVSRRICWKTASMSASSRPCSVTPGSTPLRSTPRWPHARCAP
jgi:site-specific recombinase XerD